MIFDIDHIKKWSKISETRNIIEHFISMGFESFINKEKNIEISLPYNKKNFSNLFAILDNLLNFDYLKNFYNKSEFENKIKISNDIPKFCPLFNGIIIKNINCNKKIPFFIKKILIKNNLPITGNLIVNVINYVTLITGQPLHAYDLENISGNINITKTNKNEQIITINKSKINLDNDTPVIRDNEKIISLPGIIGCYNTIIKEKTKNILLESAFFDNNIIKNIKKKYKIETEASSLFKEIVNIKFSKFALIYSSFLFKFISKSKSSNMLENTTKKYNFKDLKFNIKKKEIKKIIGINLSEKLIKKCFQKTNFTFKIFKKYIKIKVPFYRKDIHSTDSLISEFIKSYNYKKIPLIPLNYDITFKFKKSKLKQVVDILINNGFYEIITYSFVNSKIEKILYPDAKLIYIKNPISSEMNVMRFNLLQGLLKTVQTNINRGNENLCLFEIGNTFEKENKIIEKKTLAGICTQQFISDNYKIKRENSFFIIKNIVKNVCNLYFDEKTFFTKSENKPFINMNESLSILINKKIVGNFCLINKNILEIFNIKQDIYLFYIYLEENKNKKIKFYNKISKYQKIKKDLSIIINKNILCEHLLNFIKNFNIIILKQLNILDVYFFKDGKKSITIRLFLQSNVKTLSDKEIKFIIFFLKEKIKKYFKAIVKN